MSNKRRTDNLTPSFPDFPELLEFPNFSNLSEIKEFSEFPWEKQMQEAEKNYKKW